VSTLIFAPSQSRECAWNSVASLCGAAVWAVFAALAGLRRAHFGIIELLFLFAPLVIVPLGLELTRRLAAVREGPGADPVSLLQIPAALAVSIAFWLPPGRTAAFLAAGWLLQCVLLAGRRFLHWRDEERMHISPILNLAHFDLILGAAWLVLSRAGFRPMGFQEPIILLTAVHFHYGGFATALIASATLRAFHQKKLNMPGLPVLVWLIALLPFVLATGFVFSPLLRMVAAISLSTCITALAMILWWLAGEWRSRTARIYVRAASWAAGAAFFLAGLYAVSEYFGKNWITIPGMANSHGVLNGLGFVQLAMLAWLIELREPESSTATQPASSPAKAPADTQTAMAFARSTATPGPRGAEILPTPDFVARDFYDG
jgi:YndJ-like protein